jgi:hypothetical protein
MRGVGGVEIARVVIIVVVCAAAACSSKSNPGGTGEGSRWVYSSPIDPPDPTIGDLAGTNTDCGGPGQCPCSMEVALSTYEICGECAGLTAPCIYCESGRYCSVDPCSQTCFVSNPGPQCPSSAPNDCGDGHCCPNDFSYCCPGGASCGRTADDCNSVPMPDGGGGSSDPCNVLRGGFVNCPSQPSTDPGCTDDYWGGTALDIEEATAAIAAHGGSWTYYDAFGDASYDYTLDITTCDIRVTAHAGLCSNGSAPAVVNLVSRTVRGAPAYCLHSGGVCGWQVVTGCTVD